MAKETTRKRMIDKFSQVIDNITARADDHIELPIFLSEVE